MTAPLTPEQVADVLDDAADYIEASGWYQGGPGGGSRGVCALTALCLMAQRDAEAPVSVAPVYGAMAEQIGRPNVVAWNDDPARTRQEVLDAFRAAAKQQRGRSPA